MEILTEWDELQEAFSRVNLDEEVMPVIGGRLVENEDAYIKAQKMLKCSEMRGCHEFLMNCDFGSLEEEEADKIDKLYDIGVKNNLIKDTLTPAAQDDECPECAPASDVPAADQTPNDMFGYQPDRPAMQDECPCFTILYSATKDGETKCGQCFSNSVSVSAAKADCLAKLAKFGYENVTVLAVEAGCSGNASQKLPSTEVQKPAETPAPAVEQPDSLTQSDLDAMVAEACDETKKDGFDDMMKEAEKEFKEREFDAMMKEATASKNPYAVGMKMFEDDEEKKEEPKEEPKTEEPKEEPKEEAPAEEPKAEEPKEEAPADDAPAEGGDEGGDDSLDIPSFDMGDDNGGDGDSAPADDQPAEGGDEGGDEGSEDKPADDQPAEGGEDKPAEDGEKEELSAEKKAELRDSYQKAFKEVLKNYPDKSYHDLTIDQQLEFIQKLKETWDKPNPEIDFMTDKEISQLYAVKDVPEEGSEAAGEDKPDEEKSEEGGEEKPADEEKPEEGGEDKPEEEKPEEDSDESKEDKE